jgi:glucose dehydrogenase
MQKKLLTVWMILAFAIAFYIAAQFRVRAAEVGPESSSKASSATRPPSTDWPVYGGQLADDHYSSLSQINRNNVGKLKVAWTFDTGEKGGLQTSPLVVGRVLYAYSPSQKVIALDAATGPGKRIQDLPRMQ